MPDDPLYDINDIEKILPHREPFLFVDRVTRFTSNEKIAAEKELSPDAWFFAGHFPGKPMMPGVLISEALAQASGLLLGLTWKVQPEIKESNVEILFLANVKMKYAAPAYPGDTLELMSGLTRKFGGLYLFDVRANVGTETVVRGSLALGEGGF